MANNLIIFYLILVDVRDRVALFILNVCWSGSILKLGRRLLEVLCIIISINCSVKFVEANYHFWFKLKMDFRDSWYLFKNLKITTSCWKELVIKLKVWWLFITLHQRESNWEGEISVKLELPIYRFLAIMPLSNSSTESSLFLIINLSSVLSSNSPNWNCKLVAKCNREYRSVGQCWRSTCAEITSPRGSSRWSASRRELSFELNDN